ncbi:hypothetical protein [Flammeovirga pacifica]|nr:hypothetical protein [Flammeovirga pacifica]
MSTSFTISENTLKWGSENLFNNEKKKREAEKSKSEAKTKGKQ